ncbi:MAG: hypothetical protein C4334_12485 [Pyrinomonas sp.]|uniref:lytic transglycosylase domain-containing protein n=1 Tax=Pyrinomonas sp. TaxID=2080306 RepID=UPI0033194490
MRSFALVWCWIALLFGCAAAQTPARYSLDNIDLGSFRLRDESAEGLRRSRLLKPVLHAANRVASLRTLTGEKLLHARPSGESKEPSHWLRGFTTGNAQIDALLVEAGLRHGVDPMLLYAVMHQESAFRPRAISPKGARGLMQLMPGTAQRFGVTNIFDPRQNIEGGTRYLRFLLNIFDDDVALALAGYNAGEGAVLRYGGRIPPYRETREYVRRITERYRLMCDPETARRAKRVGKAELAAIEAEQPKPATVYERSVFAVRLPDGKFRLVSQ